MTTECSQIVGQICERMRAVNDELAKVRAESDRYRAALVEIIDTEASRAPSQQTKSEQIALNALATRTESGQLPDDSGPIAEAGK